MQSWSNRVGICRQRVGEDSDIERTKPESFGKSDAVIPNMLSTSAPEIQFKIGGCTAKVESSSFF